MNKQQLIEFAEYEIKLLQKSLDIVKSPCTSDLELIRVEKEAHNLANMLHIDICDRNF